MFLLTHEEIEQLTGKVRKPAQVRALRFMGVEHKIRPDGAVIVSRSHVEKILDGDMASKVKRRVEPNWKNV